jgi:hypothetical protein
MGLHIFKIKFINQLHLILNILLRLIYNNYFPLFGNIFFDVFLINRAVKLTN